MRDFKMSKKQPKIVILLGRSGSGKGTQAKLLIKEFGFDYLCGGNLLRTRAKKNDFNGRKLKKVMESGELAPTHLVFNIWLEQVEKKRDSINKKGLILDGNPRILIEAQLIDIAFDWYEWSDVKVILLDISHQEAFDRLTSRRICQKCSRIISLAGDFVGMKVCDKCGGELVTRSDDKPEAIRARLDYYKREVEPVVKYYEKQKRLIRVDGEKSVEDVYQDIKRIL